MEGYFKYVGGRFDLARTELFLIKEFCQLLERYKSQETQMEIFKYIYLVSDRRSHLVEEGLDESKLSKRALHDCKLPKNFDLSTLYPAIKRYKEINCNKPSFKIYVSLLRSFNKADEVINILQNEITKNLQDENRDAQSNLILIDIMEKLLNLGKRIPKDLESLNIAFKMVQKELDSEENLTKSGEEIDDSMIPEKY